MFICLRLFYSDVCVVIGDMLQLTLTTASEGLRHSWRSRARGSWVNRPKLSQANNSLYKVMHMYSI